MSPPNDLFVITGATGNIGSKTAEILLKKGKSVRAVGRQRQKLNSLSEKGAETFVGDIGNSAEMVKAFQGAKAIFALIPPDYAAQNMRAYQNTLGTALAEAIAISGVKYVVNLSSMGAHLAEKTGPIMGLRDQEERLNKIKGVNILHLRPSYFMENLLMNVGLIKSMNIAGSPLNPDVPTPMIATQDIAEAVAQSLLSLTFSGKTMRELLGPCDVTMKKVTQALGRSINKPDLPYVQFPYSEAEKAMIQMGLSPDAAAQMIDLQKSINEGWLKSANERTVENTTPTTIEIFASTVFAPLFKGEKTTASI